jgi:large subunit ribosomal protein L6
MSRIGKLPISIPEKVEVTVNADNVVTVKGPKGELTQKVDPSIEVVIEGGVITLTYAGGKTLADATKQEHAYHGLYRALINNMVIGVSAGFTKELELVGVGYRVNDKPNNAIELLLGYSHGIYMQFPAEVKVTTKSERNKNPIQTNLASGVPTSNDLFLPMLNMHNIL